MWVDVFWSGGDDCFLVCHKAIFEGFEVSHLLDLIFKDKEPADLLNEEWLTMGILKYIENGMR